MLILLACAVYVLMHVTVHNAVLLRCLQWPPETDQLQTCSPCIQVSGRTGRPTAARMHSMMWAVRQVCSGCTPGKTAATVLVCH
jgi:hypothetical protein